MDCTKRTALMQQLLSVQHELLPQLGEGLDILTPKLEKLVHVLDWLDMAAFFPSRYGVDGRPPHDRQALAIAFVAKVVLNLPTTAALRERLQVDRSLRHICGFPRWKPLPSEATFSRAFDEFAQSRLAERVHESLIRSHLGDELVGHISRDATAIEAREQPEAAPKPAPAADEPAAAPRKRGRPRKGEQRPAKESPIARQRKKPLAQLLEEMPKACDRGTKCNAQGYKVSWNGYKLHIDTADGGIPVAAILSSASMHDSLAAIPLTQITARRVTNLYDLMDAGYCSADLREYSREFNHVPLIDHNPRRGDKIEFDPAEAIRYRERSAAERTNARLKDEFGGNNVWVKGHAKVLSHLMFGLMVLAADQLMRLLL
ncbi:MAG: transposase [Thiolinea sp.]